MTPEQKRRAGLAVDQRIKEMEASVTAVARAAGVDAKTLRNLINGKSWPGEDVQRRIEGVLRWREGEIAARAVQAPEDGVSGYTDAELAAELHRRLVEREKREARLRRTDR